MRKNEDSPQGILDTIKRSNIYIVRISEEKEKKKGIESIFKAIMVENIQNLERETFRIKRPKGHQLG